MRVPKILRWLSETVAFVGVAVATGCPHCAAVTVMAIGGVEHVCHD